MRLDFMRVRASWGVIFLLLKLFNYLLDIFEPIQESNGGLWIGKSEICLEFIFIMVSELKFVLD